MSNKLIFVIVNLLIDVLQNGKILKKPKMMRFGSAMIVKKRCSFAIAMTH